MRAARRRYVTFVALTGVGVTGAGAAGLWSAGGLHRTGPHSWIWSALFILVPLLGLVVAGLIGWRVRSRSARPLLTSGTPRARRQAHAALRAGQLLAPEQRGPVQALVDATSWPSRITVISAGSGVLWVGMAFADRGHEFWVHLALGVLWLANVPLTGWSARRTLRRAAEQGIRPITTKPPGRPRRTR